MTKKNEQHSADPKTHAGLLAEFATEHELVEASKRVHDAGYRLWDAYSPYPIHDLIHLSRKRSTVMAWCIFFCGAGGALIALLLQWYTNAFDYPFIISGKPPFGWPAAIPVTFELTVLFSAFGAFFGMLAFNALPRFIHPVFSSKRFERVTTDGFFISVAQEDPKYSESETDSLLLSTGATAVEALTTPTRAAMGFPRWVVLVILLLCAVALVPLSHVTLARVSKSANPPISVIRDMDNQPKFRPQEANVLFADGRAMRPPVEGTVAQGTLNRDEHFMRGRVDGGWALRFPMPVTEELMKRGENRFGIYCAPCHGLSGYGDGMISRRADELQQGTWVPPLSYHSEDIRRRPLGHIFNTITHGIRNMPPLGGQVPADDRWAIIAYVRALQRSQYATMEDIPPQAREAMIE